MDHHPNNTCLFAKSSYGGHEQLVGIGEKDRRNHFYTIGKTGTGKTTLLENMLVSDIRNGAGVGIVDPHGDLSQRLLSFIPSERINQVVYINPADEQWPLAFNPLAHANAEGVHLLASTLVSVFKKTWADSWGPRLEYILRNVVLTLLECPHSTLLWANRLLVEDHFRKRVVSKIEDPLVKSFWFDEYNKYPERLLREVISPLQNKLGALLSSRPIRNIIGQEKSLLAIDHLMDSGKILIINLSKGLIGEDASRLLGTLFVTEIQLAAMARAKMPEAERRDFYFYIDEFQNFSTQSFADILAEARKYRLNLILAHQYMDQLEPEIKSAVLGNVGTMVVFRVGADDARNLENEFMPEYGWLDLVNLFPYEIYYKLMRNGKVLRPHPGESLPPAKADLATEQKDKIINYTRTRYCRPRDIVERKIEDWLIHPHL